MTASPAAPPFDDQAGDTPDIRRRALLLKASAALGGAALAGASCPFLLSLAPSEFLVDPDSRVQTQQPAYARNTFRAIEPDIFVSLALCTHLGCVPTFMPQPRSVQPDWPGGFYCPCHGSKFDLAGRVFAGSPAPTNLVIPPHHYAGNGRLMIGSERAKKTPE